MKWWNQDGSPEEHGEDVAISQVELREHVEEIWEKMGGRKLEKRVAQIREGIDKCEGEQRAAIEMAQEDYEEGWDDVHGGEIAIQDFRKIRKEEIAFMTSRMIWSAVPEAECWEKTGKAPV